MKRTTLLLLLLSFLASGKGSAQDARESGWYFGTSLGVDCPTYNFNPAYNLGLGGKFLVGFDLDRTLAIQIDSYHFDFPAPGGGVYDLRIVPQLKGTLDLERFQPYFMLGPGIDLEFGPGLSTSNFDLMAGPGFQFDLGGGTRFFFESKLHFIFASGVTGMDLPLECGLTFKL